MNNKNKFFIQQKIFSGTSCAAAAESTSFEKLSGEIFTAIEDLNIAGSERLGDFSSVSESRTSFETDTNEQLTNVNSFSNLNSNSYNKQEWFNTGFSRLPFDVACSSLLNGAASILQKKYTSENTANTLAAETLATKSTRQVQTDTERQNVLSPIDHFLTEITTENAHLKKSLLTIQNENSELKELNRSKNGLISIISHDLKNPFGALLTMSEFLATEVEELEKEEVLEFAQTINVSAKVLYKFFNDLLEWSKLQNGLVKVQPVQIEVKGLVDHLFTLLNIIAAPKEIRLINNVDDVKLFADNNMLCSILNNLLTNAIKFTNGGDCVVVEAEELEGVIKFAVKDNGVGMAKNILDKIFTLEKHITNSGTNNEIGSGLGLVITKELITRHGGCIWAESEEGKGTTFYFTLPKGAAQA